MKKSTILILLLMSVFAVSCNQEGVGTEGVDDYSQIPADRIDSQKEIGTTTGKKYKVVSYHDEKGQKHKVYFDSENKKVDYDKDIKPFLPPSSPYGETLEEQLKGASEAQKEQPVECMLDFNDFVPRPEWPDSGDQTVSVDGRTGELIIEINGKRATKAQLDALESNRKALLDKYNADRKKKKQEVLKELVDNNSTEPGNAMGLEIEDEAKEAYLRGDMSYLEITLKLGKVEEFYQKNKTLIRLLEIKAQASTD